jgi:hypothetical protein
MTSRKYFWLTAAAAAIALAALAALLLPYQRLQMESLADRQGGWLLTVWTAGVMAIFFGVSGLLMSVAPVGFRDVHEAGGVLQALAKRRDERERAGDSNFYNFAGWTVSTGGFLVLIYFAAWFALTAQGA